MRLRFVLLAISVIGIIGFVVVQRSRQAQTSEPNQIAIQAPVINCYANVQPMINRQNSSRVTNAGCEVIPAAINGDSLHHSPNDHCVLNIEPISKSKDSKNSDITDTRCFASFHEAIEYATDGFVTLSADMSPEMLTQTMLAPAVTAKNLIIGIQFSAEHGGLSQIWATSQLAGCNGYSYGFATMLAGWDEQISVAKAFSNCSDFEHYEHANWTGLRIDCTQACPGMGAMNNQTSSWRLDNVLP
ncbi:hypothetical protein [Herpetosiphon sp. NSE202]|uniref:hypothetical protein n=1 Tax=Herpetosiphon sp. NSE202 TaxID=3351349 RepID=UPI003645EDE2